MTRLLLMGVERRIHNRYDVVAQVELEANDETIMLPLRNISLGGALLEISDSQAPALHIGDALSAFLDFGSDAQGEDLALSLEAEVVRFEEEDGTPTRVAVRWVRGSLYQLRKLGEIVDQITGDEK